MFTVIFIIFLFMTFIISRLGAYTLHDHEGYKIKNEKSKTLTGIVRRKSGLDIHHIHFGIIILLLVIPFVLIKGVHLISTILLSVGISLFIDQIVPYIFKKTDYFSFRDFLVSLFLHIFVALIVLLRIF